METVWFIEDTSNQKWYAWNLVPFEHSFLHGTLSSPKEEDCWTNDPQMAVRFKHPKEAFECIGDLIKRWTLSMTDDKNMYQLKTLAVTEHEFVGREK